MEKKRSIGITLFSIYFIIISVGSLILIQLKPSWFISLHRYYYVICDIALLILTVYILQLKEWARRGVIYFQILNVVLNLIFIVQQGMLPEKYPVATGLRVLVFISPIIALGVGAFVIIYFFTRPKIKEQFK